MACRIDPQALLKEAAGEVRSDEVVRPSQASFDLPRSEESSCLVAVASARAYHRVCPRMVSSHPYDPLRIRHWTHQKGVSVRSLLYPTEGALVDKTVREVAHEACSSWLYSMASVDRKALESA
jgi:hypothetical protein